MERSLRSEALRSHAGRPGPTRAAGERPEVVRPFDIVVEEPGDGRTRVRPAGEVDIGTGPLVEEEVAALVAAGVRDLELHLDRVTFLDTAGLQMILTCRGEVLAAGGRFALGELSPTVTRVLEATGVHGVLTGAA